MGMQSGLIGDVTESPATQEKQFNQSSNIIAFLITHDAAAHMFGSQVLNDPDILSAAPHSRVRIRCDYSFERSRKSAVGNKQ